MSPRVCLFINSFNPPGLHHQAAAVELARRFDSVHIIPCSRRPHPCDHDEAVPIVLRAALADLGFSSIPGVSVDCSGMENGESLSDLELERKFAPRGEVWHAVWCSQVKGGRAGESEVQTQWADGPSAWRDLRFAVLRAPEMALDPADLPPRHVVVDVPRSGSSREIRYLLYSGQSADDRLSPRVREFIHRYSLYTLGPPRTKASLDMAGKRLKIVADTWNANALAWRERLADLRDDANPDAILVLGGDGTMLRAIRDNWQLRVPFIGVNVGHLGFLMNESEELIGPGNEFAEKLIVRRLPMLHVVLTKQDGGTIEELSFNDAWVERSTGQTAWLRLSLNGEVKLERAVCDGILVSTAAGSTAYALSMGASPLLADTPSWLVVGSNVMRPLGWKSALLPMDAVVKVENVASERRPLNGFVYNARYEDVVAMEARISRVASAELAFSEAHDMARKISDLQFGTVRPV